MAIPKLLWSKYGYEKEKSMVITGGKEMGLVEEKYGHILEYALQLGKSCSILNPIDKAFTFARNEKYLKHLLEVRDKELLVLLPHNINRFVVNGLPPNIYTYIVNEEDNIEYIWTYIHNKINEDHPGGEIIIGKDCDISEHAIIGIPGNTYAKAPDGSRLHLKEIGGIKIGDRVTIAAQTLVHISCFGDTIIEDDAVICVKCNIGHNTKVGSRTYIAPGVLLGGGTQIGSDCFIWQGVITHSQIKICNKVMVGNGSYVHSDITKPGVYFGSPAKYIKPFDERVLKGEVQW
jgi:acetyltransferase-like isoleucine patch superfamily enzyme